MTMSRNFEKFIQPINGETEMGTSQECSCSECESPSRRDVVSEAWNYLGATKTMIRFFEMIKEGEEDHETAGTITYLEFYKDSLERVLDPKFVERIDGRVKHALQLSASLD